MTTCLRRVKFLPQQFTNMIKPLTQRSNGHGLQRIHWLFIGLLAVGFLYLLARSWRTPDLPPAAVSIQTLPVGCPANLSGTAGRHNDEQTVSGLTFTVVAPLNYLADHRYGLLMVFPPAGFSKEMAEHYYQLTSAGNTQGYVVVYSSAIPLSKRALKLQSEVVPQVMSRWCIDPARVVFAGHSDGGSLATGLTVRPDNGSVLPGRVVISAAGITEEDLRLEKCPAPLNVTVLHNPKDDLFPGYGAGTTRWWGDCMQCSADVAIENSGCELRQCSQGKVLRHCVTAEPHTRWPKVTSHLWEWLD